MNIFKFFKNMVIPHLEADCDGRFPIDSIRSFDDIEIMIRQFEIMPNQDLIDNNWIIAQLQLIQQSEEYSQRFVALSKKIDNGTIMNYENRSSAFIQQLQIMYPNITFDNGVAVNYKKL